MFKMLLIICLFTLNGCGDNTQKVNLDEELVNDYVSSASVKYNYLKYYLKDTALKEAINSNEGIISIGTCNPDDTINQAIISFEMIDNEFMKGSISDNQTLHNLKADPQAMLVFTLYVKDEKNVLNYQGAKILVDYISDANKRKAFNDQYKAGLADNESLFKIVEIRPLG